MSARNESLASGLKGILAGFSVDQDSPHPPEAQKAAYLARLLQQRATMLQTPQEKKQQSELERMIQNPHDKATMIQMTDQAFRSERPRRAVDQLTHILDVQGVPRFFSRVDQTLLRGFQSFGSYLPGVAVPLIKDKMRAETANVILPAEEELLGAHLEARRQEGLRMNVNLLGEALLGESEAERRLESYLEALQHPLVECISVKISTIYSQISSLAFDHTVNVLCDRLELLYREAARMRFLRTDGAEVPKFVYLDMEEYRDMAVTAEVFMRTLDRRGLEHAFAGIALQAYVPDSYATLKKINAWARKRIQGGGAPITVRIVKGANMEAERVEASIRDWPQAPFNEKIHTDANFKRMLQEVMRPENIAAVRVGIASHNLFDISYGLVLAAENDCLNRIQFELLEGMANHIRRAIFELNENVLLYAPATRKQDFIHAIGYLIRRLDENTGPNNFLRHAFKLSPDGKEWQRLQEEFFASFGAIEGLSEAPRRTQDRTQSPACPLESADFTNEPDTDFSLGQNVAWAQEIIDKWRDRCAVRAADVPLVVDGLDILEDRPIRESLDPSRPGVVVARYREANVDDVERAVQAARQDAAGWRAAAPEERSRVLAGAAQEIRCARPDLMGAALAEGGKTFLQSDPEVSEAVDFCEYYRRSASGFHAIQGLDAGGKGVVVVVSPWNFPIAIPCGGVAAALAAGNSVILKPASDTVLVAYLLCECFWRAGVPRDALQFLPGAGETVGTKLVSHPGVDAVILTGGTKTALRMLEDKPDLNLLAETGGKNAIIITALSDRDLAVKHVLHSAFGHTGQKCSAASLLILEEEIYGDPKFKATLCDAAKSLPVGSAWDAHNMLGPLIRPPDETLDRGLKELEPGESWAVMPRKLENNPNLYSPGIKWGVQPGNFTHMTELFGPVLGVMKARDLHEAIDLVNQTGYGLTSGLQSLDDREQELWRDGIRAGNLYINRVTTGAIVLRQPFGGMGKSAFGPGIKAGGPNYVAQLMDFRQAGPPRGSENIADEQLALFDQILSREDAIITAFIDREEIRRICQAIRSYDLAMGEEFGRAHDDFRLVGEDNLRRYLPVLELRIRVHPADTAFDLFARVCAAKAAGSRITVSSVHGIDLPVLGILERLTEAWGGRIEFVEESEEELADVIAAGQTERVRYAAPDRVPASVLSAVGDSGIFVAKAPVLAEGRIELLWYLREQSISFDYHRYGNLGERAEEERAAVL